MVARLELAMYKSNLFQMLIMLNHWLIQKVFWQREKLASPVCDVTYLTNFFPSR